MRVALLEELGNWRVCLDGIASSCSDLRDGAPIEMESDDLWDGVSIEIVGPSGNTGGSCGAIL